MKNAILLPIILLLLSCRPTPFEVRHNPASNIRRIEKTENIARGLSAAKKEELVLAYKKAKRPSFGIVEGYYSLPESKPFGEATVVKGYAYDSYVESVQLKGQKKAFAITPLKSDDAVAMNDAINSLIDIGVKIKEVSMSDALALAKDEEQAHGTMHHFTLRKSLPPSVDLLMSINRSSGAQGEVLTGRVITKEGQLLAFRVMQHAASSTSLGSLIISLFEDSIKRIQEHDE
jgi:hypothetical protein